MRLPLFRIIKLDLIKQQAQMPRYQIENKISLYKGTTKANRKPLAREYELLTDQFKKK